jgi:hypothetical protein
MTKSNNAIVALVETVKTTSQGAKVKTVSTSPSLTATETLNLVTESAINCGSGESAKVLLAQSIEGFNKSAINLHNGGVRLLDGRKKDPSTMANRQAFLDQCEKSGLKPKTAQNYYELFFKVVNSGKAIKSFDFKTNAKKSGGEKPEVALADILAKFYNHSEFESAPDEVQAWVNEVLVSANYL